MSVLVVMQIRAAAENRARLRSRGTKEVETRPELRFYRKYTEGMLRRYLRCSMDGGRVPSLMGREMFRGRVTSYRIRTFDDAVNFVQDVERCLRRLSPIDQRLLERIAIQEHTQGDAAAMLRMSLRTTVRRYAAALDRLSSIFLERGLLEPFMECEPEGSEEEDCEEEMA